MSLPTAPLVLFVLGLLSWSPCATGESPRDRSVSQRELSAIAAEAMRRARGEDPPGLPWQHLDTERLGRLLAMPDFASLAPEAKEVLIAQAGAWNLIRFERPSQAIAPWVRWYPERKIGVPIAPDYRGSVSSPSVARTDKYWGDESGAAIALLKCMPDPVWVVHDGEPMLAAMERLGNWDQANAFDFGSCVRQQDDDVWVAWPQAPSKVRGLRSAAVLERKLATFLLSGTCTDRGPDSCLVSLHALVSLNSRHPDLVPILKALEPGFGLTDELPDPATTYPANPWSIPWEDLGAALEPRRRILRRIFFLSAKLPVLLDQVQRWPAQELRTTLVTLVRHTLALDAVTIDRNRDLDLGRFPFSSPWKAVHERRKGSPRLAAALMRAGSGSGALAGCLPRSSGRDTLPPEFVYAYVMSKRGHGDMNCGTLPYAWIAQEYFASAKYGRSGRLEELGDARAMLELKPGRSREARELLVELRKHCKKSITRDPWQVCTPRGR